MVSLEAVSSIKQSRGRNKLGDRRTPTIEVEHQRPQGKKEGRPSRSVLSDHQPKPWQSKNTLAQSSAQDEQQQEQQQQQPLQEQQQQQRAGLNAPQINPQIQHMMDSMEIPPALYQKFARMLGPNQRRWSDLKKWLEMNAMEPPLQQRLLSAQFQQYQHLWRQQRSHQAPQEQDIQQQLPQTSPGVRIAASGNIQTTPGQIATPQQQQPGGGTGNRRLELPYAQQLQQLRKMPKDPQTQKQLQQQLQNRLAALQMQNQINNSMHSQASSQTMNRGNANTIKQQQQQQQILAMHNAGMIDHMDMDKITPQQQQQWLNLQRQLMHDQQQRQRQQQLQKRQKREKQGQQQQRLQRPGMFTTQSKQLRQRQQEQATAATTVEASAAGANSRGSRSRINRGTTWGTEDRFYQRKNGPRVGQKGSWKASGGLAHTISEDVSDQKKLQRRRLCALSTTYSGFYSA